MAYLPLFSALLGAVIGALLASWFNHLTTLLREKRQAKFKVLLTLVGGRGRMFSQEVADMINVIPVIFHRDEKVRRAYQHFCAIPNGPEVYRRYNDMVIAIAKSLGYENDLSASDIDLGFYPYPQDFPRSPSPS